MEFHRFLPSNFHCFQSLDNCKVLVPDRFHIAWTIDRSNNKITLEFQGVISLNEYLAFGISGSSSATLMMGSDVAVVWFDPSDSQPRAVDYHLNDYSQVKTILTFLGSFFFSVMEGCRRGYLMSCAPTKPNHSFPF